MRARLAFVLLLSAVALAACSESDAVGDVGVSSRRYAVQTDGSWELQEAVDLAADDPIATNQRPPLDWYSEHVRSDHTEMVLLSGHDAAFGDTRSELEQLGFEFIDVTVPGRGQGAAGNHPGDRSSPEVLLLPWGTRTVMALSYDVSRDVLLAFMTTVEGAGRDEWVGAGGVVR